MEKPLLSVSASAGSGKTYRLTRRYLELLFNNAEPASILTLTFTKKAAKEMEERIFKEIRELYENRTNINHIKKFEFININNYSTEADFKELEKKIENIYNKCLRDDLKITTIDAFFQRILRNFCWYVGVDYDFNVKSDDDEAITNEFLEILDKSDFAHIVDSCYKNRKNLDSILGLCIFLDSFKESIHKQKNLFSKTMPQNSDFYKDLALQNANELKKTYSSVEDSLKNDRNDKAMDFYNFDTLLDKGKTWLTKEYITDYRGFSKIPFNNYDFEATKENIKNAFEATQEEFLSDLHRIFECFLRAKKIYEEKNKTLSFSTIASKVYELLIEKEKEEVINKDFLYFRLDSVINHILIDEFQDTSILQYEILKPLIDEIKAGNGQKNFTRSFFYVGDIKQSIYRFRGGNPELFKHASENGVLMEVLDTNYRSSKNIVKFVNETFKGSEIKGFEEQKANLKEEGFVEVKMCDDLDAQVLDSIRKLKDNGAKDESITILVFDNKSVTQFAELLSENKIKAVIDTSEKLIKHNEVRASIQALKFIAEQNEQYIYEFCALLGFEYSEQYTNSVSEFLNTLKHLQNPSKILLKIFKQYKIASLSAKKFLESTLEYATLDELIQSVESLELDIVSSDFSGIRILTIHKSKGLEFDNVIIVDKKKAAHPVEHGVFFTFKENGIDIDKLFYKKYSSLRESLDKDYKEALEKEKALEKKDLLNQLYVAFTRAKNTMQILMLDEKSSFEELNLSPKIYGNLQDSIKIYNEVCNKNSTEQNKDIFYKSASKKLSLEHLGEQKDMQVAEQKQSESNANSVYFGVALHFALEQKIKHNLSDELILELLYNKFGFYLDKATLEKILKHCNLVLKNQNFIEIMAKGKVKCEIPFLKNGRQKRIDLLIEGEKDAYIIDYKSGKAQESHALQVKEYADSVQKMLKKVAHGYIFYLLDGEKGNLVKI